MNVTPEYKQAVGDYIESALRKEEAILGRSISAGQKGKTAIRRLIRSPKRLYELAQKLKRPNKN